MPEIDVKILDLCRPWSGDRRFNAAAGRPANLRVTRVAEARDVCLDAAECGASGEVGHDPIKRVTEATARGAEPVVTDFADCDAAAADCAADDVSVVDVALKPEHNRPSLPVISNRSAGEPTGRVE